MIELYYILKGTMIGFLISAPMGPVSLLCIRTSISKGRMAGLAVGLGATLGDAFYAAIAAFGLSFLIQFLRREEFWLRLVGGAFLMIMGAYVFFKKQDSPKLNDQAETKHFTETIGSAFLLDISNPIIILAYLAIFSGFGLASAQRNFFSAIALVIGVALGAAIWWFLLTQLIALFRNNINQKNVLKISQAGAVFLFTFGVFVIVASFYPIPFLKGYF